MNYIIKGIAHAGAVNLDNPQEGQELTLALMPPDNGDLFKNEVPREPQRVRVKIIRIGEAPSGLVDAPLDGEPAIWVQQL